jgi:predicted nucleic acid-binding protein
VNKPSVIIDAGAIVAILNRADQHHAWASRTAQALVPPFLITESALTEACYLFQKTRLSLAPVVELITSGTLIIPFVLVDEIASIHKLIQKFHDMPKGQMSLADASLVRLAELYPDAAMFTLDTHFTIYRKNGRQRLKLITPEAAR